MPAGEPVGVTKIVDGDTIEVTGGRKVRLLGIDACELSTAGGREAKDLLGVYLAGHQVRLVADGRRDADDYGRLLRRVDRHSGDPSRQEPSGNGSYREDVGLMMVGDVAVGVYEGTRNDASPAYLTELRERDRGGARDCAGAPAAPSSDVRGNRSADGGDVNLPDGALTGGFCARKWWC